MIGASRMNETATKAKTVVLGLGNLLLRDEGVGIHAIRGLRERELPPDVELVDGGTAALDLLAFLQRAERVIVLDAVRRGDEPGTVYRFRLEPKALQAGSVPLSLHELSLPEALGVAQKMGIHPEVIVLGVEPQTIEPGLELSPQVRAALPRLLDAVCEELRRSRGRDRGQGRGVGPYPDEAGA